MSTLANCPACQSAYTYKDRGFLVCSECAHKWNETDKQIESADAMKYSNGNVLNDGNSITLIKGLKIKGASSVLKIGTKVKNIRLVDGDHNIDCKIDGFGTMKLKSEFVKKV